MQCAGSWLPEDLLCIIVQWDNTRYCDGQWDDASSTCHGVIRQHQDGLRGTEIGSQLRRWAREHGRPLIWTDGRPGDGMPGDYVEAMILDPSVGFGGDRITANDRKLFENHWSVPNNNL